jgi:heme exporter protein D
MAFDSLTDFWAMGTHGMYVWTSYALTFSTIVLLLWHAKKARQRFFYRANSATQTRAAKP